jgi:hypothetical protein
MTQAAKRPSTATRRTGGSQPALNEHGPRGEHDLHGEQDLIGDRDRDDGNDRDDRTERDERNSGDEQREQRARREQDARREDRADDRDERAERNSDDEQSDQRQRTERGEQGHAVRGELGEPGREPGGVQRSLEQVTDRVRSATSTGGDTLAPTPDMSKVLAAWFDMAGDMMKLQQQFFAKILGDGNTNDRNTTKV